MRPIYYDSETTGVKPDKDRMVELAAYDPVNDRSFCELINPEMLIPKEAEAIHKISNEMVRDAKKFDEVGAAFFEFCSGDVVLIAHNNDAFDQLFLIHESKRCGLTLPNFTYLDTLKWARKFRPDLPRHSLQYLRETYQVEANNAHRALDDVIILHKVFSQMVEDLPLSEILALLSKSEIKEDLRFMPFGKHKGEAFEELPKHYVKWLLQSGALDKPENTLLKAKFEALPAAQGK